MVFELHIWGPAFGLPSIDAECLATVAYLRHAVPKGEWVLIASSDPSISLTNELPALKAGSRWVSRFRNIVDYLHQYSAGEWNLDMNLDQWKRADCVAFSSFVESRGQPLLDLSIYVSSDNYTTCTRSALADILPWPNKWIVPPKLRAVAKKRSEHLGLSSLDIHAAQEENSEGQKLTGQIPKSLLKKPNETVSEILGKSTHRSQFRLDAVTSEFLEPLVELLHGKEWFLSDAMTSLDCLVLGYLSLMQSPMLPHDWLKNALKYKNSVLGKWADRVSGITFGPSITASDVIRGPKGAATEKNDQTLPWQAPVRPTLAGMGVSVIEGVLDSIPIVNQLRANRQLKAESEDPDLDGQESESLARHAKYQNREMYSQIIAVGTSIGAFVGYLVWIGAIKLPESKREAERRRDFGAAGQLLGLD